MSNFQAFWSYVHADDEAEAGRISQLARDVVAQFEMLTGEQLTLFLDKDAIDWGEGWREKIDSTLASVAFFIPVLTPRYFLSPECRRELQFFARRATKLGIKELVLPLLYVDVQTLRIESAESSKDELVSLVRTLQWKDWRDLRFSEIRSESYRREVSRLAERLVEANRQAEISSLPNIDEISDGKQDNSTDESPGFLDQMAAAEATIPQWNSTMEKLGLETLLIAKHMTESGAQAQNQSFSNRVKIMRNLAARLKDPVDHMYSLSNDFASQLHTMDEGIREVIKRAIVESQSNPGSRSSACKFFNELRVLSGAVNNALQGAKALINLVTTIETASRDLRPTMRRFRQGLAVLIESGEVTNEWVRLVDESGLSCA